MCICVTHPSATHTLCDTHTSMTRPATVGVKGTHCHCLRSHTPRKLNTSTLRSAQARARGAKRDTERGLGPAGTRRKSADDP